VAHEKFRVEVLTPEGEVFKDEVEQVSTRTSTGSISFLAHHQPLLGMLEPTELRLYRSEGDIVSLVQGEGYVQVSPEQVLILVEEAMEPANVDIAEIQERLDKAERELSEAEKGSAAERKAQRDKRRWETFLNIARDAGAS
jgi:F-type H+-transporting ATPase subunit epsilon